MCKMAQKEETPSNVDEVYSMPEVLNDDEGVEDSEEENEIAESNCVSPEEWATTTAEAIRKIELRCTGGSTSVLDSVYYKPVLQPESSRRVDPRFQSNRLRLTYGNSRRGSKREKQDRPKSDSSVDEEKHSKEKAEKEEFRVSDNYLSAGSKKKIVKKEKGDPRNSSSTLGNQLQKPEAPRRTVSEKSSLKSPSLSFGLNPTNRTKQLTVSFSGFCGACGFPEKFKSVRKSLRGRPSSFYPDRIRRVSASSSENTPSQEREDNHNVPFDPKKSYKRPATPQTLELPETDIKYIDASSRSSLSADALSTKDQRSTDNSTANSTSPNTPSTRSCSSVPDRVALSYQIEKTSSISPNSRLLKSNEEKTLASSKTTPDVPYPTPEASPAVGPEQPANERGSTLDIKYPGDDNPILLNLLYKATLDEDETEEETDDENFEDYCGKRICHYPSPPTAAGCPAGNSKCANFAAGDSFDSDCGQIGAEIMNKFQGEPDKQSVYSLYMDKDFRYYFQHPYARLFVSYFVIFCNFLIFAEDPVSHSHTESEIPVVGNVFSFVATKYPPQYTWVFLKVTLWLIAILGGLVCGKYIIHHLLLRDILRLKMFREEQGTWMIMLLTIIISIYLFSMVYNFFLAGHPEYDRFAINAQMGITNANFMKAAACGTWLGDFVTAWMVTDMMLQDNLYSEWARPFRRFWKSHTRTRICIFWGGSIFMTSLVVTLIVSDRISWDRLNRDFVATTELSRAFLASFILVMDLLIVMQDWDFPHFVCDLDIKLPGLHVASFKFNLFKKYVNIPDVFFHISDVDKVLSKEEAVSKIDACIALDALREADDAAALSFKGKWFNYGIIIIVMILDLNMWKNQIFYNPIDYGQYTGPDLKVHTVNDPEVLSTGNSTLWSYEWRSTHIDPTTNRSFTDGDMQMNSRYLHYSLSATGLAFVPSLLGFVMFGALTFVYGRFPPKTDETAGGRLKKRKREAQRSSWRRERGQTGRDYGGNRDYDDGEGGKRKAATWGGVLRGGRRLTDVVVAWNKVYGTTCTASLGSCREKPASHPRNVTDLYRS